METTVRDEVPTPTREAPKYLRVMVDGTDHKDGRPVHVNVRVPLLLLRFGARFASFLPPQAQQQVTEALRKEGMDVDVSKIKPEDLNQLLEQLRDLSIDIQDEHEDVTVRIYVE